MKDWSVYRRPWGGVVEPNDDLHEHDRDSEDCACKPFWDGEVLVHNAFDGRQVVEARGRVS